MTVSIVIGVDPGVHGAIAFLSPAGELLAVEDTPIDTIQIGKNSRSRLSRHRLLTLFAGVGGAADAEAFIEQPTYRPMKRRNPKTGAIETAQMGVAGAGAFGETYGILTMALVAAGAALHETPLSVWRSAVGLKGGKDDACRLVSDLYPAMARMFARVKDHGRAEAVLIGRYGVQMLKNGAK